MRWPRIAVVFLLFGMLPASASSDPSAMCETTAIQTARTSGVPVDVLRALTLTETGRASGGTLRPWPWAINQAGEGIWFPTQEQMLDHARGLIAQGMTNFDIGCFQLNYRWHVAGFASLEDMADPAQNARYAARYLAGKYANSGNWAQAAAAYHSGTPELANRYLARFSGIYASLGPAPADPLPVSAEPDRPNLFPLLIVGHSGGGGSLVPLAAVGRRIMGGDE